MKNYIIQLGNSTFGVLGATIRVSARNKRQALISAKYLLETMAADNGICVAHQGGDSLRLYLNPAALTLSQVKLE